MNIYTNTNIYTDTETISIFLIYVYVYMYHTNAGAYKQVQNTLNHSTRTHTNMSASPGCSWYNPHSHLIPESLN